MRRKIKIRAWNKTGLKDTKNKDIYEGDVIRRKKMLVEVVWRESEAGFYAKCPARWPGFGVPNILYKSVRWASEGEVIGNVYQDPELIES